jgi:hypothetical protein
MIIEYLSCNQTWLSLPMSYDSLELAQKANPACILRVKTKLELRQFIFDVILSSKYVPSLHRTIIVSAISESAGKEIIRDKLHPLLWKVESSKNVTDNFLFL